MSTIGSTKIVLNTKVRCSPLTIGYPAFLSSFNFSLVSSTESVFEGSRLSIHPMDFSWFLIYRFSFHLHDLHQPLQTLFFSFSPTCSQLEALSDSGKEVQNLFKGACGSFCSMIVAMRKSRWALSVVPLHISSWQIQGYRLAASTQVSQAAIGKSSSGSLFYAH